jgi:peroxiredoxin Q/BCP
VRLRPGSRAPEFTVVSADGQTHSLAAYRGTPVLLQFYRYAGCPMCDLRLHDFSREYPRLQAKGLQVIAFFHSSPERVQRHLRDRRLTFPVVGDSAQRVYRQYGVETSIARFLLTMLKPSFYWDWLRSMRHGYWGSADWRMATMPADFLIASDQTILRVHYGRDIGDHMPVALIEQSLEALE